MARKTLAEAAADIFGGNIADKRGQRDGHGKNTETVISHPNDGSEKMPGPTPDDNSYSELKPAEDGAPHAKARPADKPKLATEEPVEEAEKEVTEDEDLAEEEEVTEEDDKDDEVKEEKKDEAVSESIADKVKAYVKDNGAVNMDEDMKALFQGEKLSENFMKKAKVIFETAVIEKATKVCEQIESEFVKELEEAVEQIQGQLVENVDSYLNYMVEEWVTENEVGIEKGIRTELAEEFMASIKNVFLEHYIDIPDDKVNVVEELAAKIEELEGKINEEMERGVALNKQILEHKKNEVLKTVTEGLVATQVEKINELAKNYSYTDTDSFRAALTELRESYFPASPKAEVKQQLDEASVEGDERGVTETEIADPEIQAYVRTISKNKV